MSDSKTPNRICFNPECRKPFYACDSCIKEAFAWRKVCCSIYCFQEYMRFLELKDGEGDVRK